MVIKRVPSCQLLVRIIRCGVISRWSGSFRRHERLIAHRAQKNLLALDFYAALVASLHESGAYSSVLFLMTIILKRADAGTFFGVQVHGTLIRGDEVKNGF